MIAVTEVPLSPDDQRELWKWLSAPGRRIYQQYLVGRAASFLAEAGDLTVADKDIDSGEKSKIAIDYLRLNTLLESHGMNQIAFTQPELRVKSPSEAMVTTTLT